MKFTEYCTHSKAWFRNNVIKQTFWVTHYFKGGLRFYNTGSYRYEVKEKINKDINKLK